MSTDTFLADPDDADGGPVPDEILTDDSRPGSTPVFKTPVFDKKRHNAVTRRALALGSLTVLVLFYAAIVACFVLRLITMEELTGLIAALSGLQALAAAAWGYYFAKST